MTARFGQSVPACHATAEVIDCYPLSSVDGPVPVVRYPLPGPAHPRLDRRIGRR